MPGVKETVGWEMLRIILTNIVLGVVVLVCALAVIFGVLQQSISGRRKQKELSRELDQDLRKLVEEYGGDGRILEDAGSENDDGPERGR